MEKIILLFEQFLSNVSETASHIVPGILLIIFSLVFAFLVAFLIRVLLNMVHFNQWFEKTSFVQMLKAVGLDLKIHHFISKLIFWLMFLFMVQAISEASNWGAINVQFDKYFLLLPLLMGAVIIIIAGFYLSRFIRNSSQTILSHASPGTAVIISNSLFYILMAITFTVALNYLGVETGIITTNISIILGSLLLSFSLAFVFASREILSNILSSSYNRKTFQVGQKVRIGENKGEIIRITNISVVIRSDNRIQVIPSRQFTEQVVEIIA